tara:strand:+ start:124 stop:603 length:480 start_codon:yes stop_codon:yes gene_type:complete
MSSENFNPIIYPNKYSDGPYMYSVITCDLILKMFYKDIESLVSIYTKPNTIEKQSICICNKYLYLIKNLSNLVDARNLNHKLQFERLIDLDIFGEETDHVIDHEFNLSEGNSYNSVYNLNHIYNTAFQKELRYFLSSQYSSLNQKTITILKECISKFLN